MRAGHTYTRHFSLETRQHELLGLDLGEGPPRRALVLGLVLFVLWDGPLLLIFGMPGEFTFTAYVLPPVLVSVYGMQRSPKNDRRRYITVWALKARYLTAGHRPLVNGGRRAAARSEWLPRRARWGSTADAVLSMPGARVLEPLFGRQQGMGEVRAGAALRLEARPRLYGPDRVGRAYGRSLTKKGAA